MSQHREYMENNSIIQDYAGSCKIIKDHPGSRVIIQDHAVYFRIMEDRVGLCRIIRCHGKILPHGLREWFEISQIGATS